LAGPEADLEAVLPVADFKDAAGRRGAVSKGVVVHPAADLLDEAARTVVVIEEAAARIRTTPIATQTPPSNRWCPALVRKT